MEKSTVLALTDEKIGKIVKSQSMSARFTHLQKYYLGKHKILKAAKRDRTVPNNRIVNNLAKYITDTATGYFIGKPVVYASENKPYLELIQDIFNYNDEQDHNLELAKQCSIVGSCFEMLYLDEDGMLRLARIGADNLIMIYETENSTLAPLAAIRKICTRDEQDRRIIKVEYWDQKQVRYYRQVEGGKLEFLEAAEHYFGDVPFVEYINNEERTGDFEGEISKIDAYNKVQSNTANYFEYNDDAILKISKLGDVNSNDVADMKEKGAIILEDGGDVGWLLKVIDDTALENYKTRLRKDIHSGANVPDMTDEAFSGNLSGVAVSYKLWGLEQVCAIKERKFKRGLQRRLELLTNILNIRGGNYDYRDIQLSFRRNKPQNLLETAQVVTMLTSELSRETRLQMLPVVEDVQTEMAKLKKERDQDVDDFGTYEKFAKAFQTPPPESDSEPPSDEQKKSEGT
jgi:SPP1 family phage portal protein